MFEKCYQVDLRENISLLYEYSSVTVPRLCLQIWI